ncbi:hypothetical protein [Luteolibacter sp. Populi]|uniref:hypothetical protein n=1 Tax=Luteolibacter sp. Populi TaxID=3230487 RepID=UPI0034653C77
MKIKVGTQSFSSPHQSLEMLPHQDYTLALDIHSEVVIACDTVATLKFPHCNVEYQKNGESTWTRESEVKILIDADEAHPGTFTMKPSSVTIRLTPEESDDKGGTEEAGTEAELENTAPNVGPNPVTEEPEEKPAGLGLEISAGAAQTENGTYRSAGSLTKYGSAGAAFAAPQSFEFHAPSEILANLEPPYDKPDGIGGIYEKHFIVPDAVLRLVGWTGSAERSYTGATQSLVEVYERSQYNAISHTFSGPPHSYYRLEIQAGEGIWADGTTLVQSNRGVSRTESIQASNDGFSTRHQKGAVVTEKLMVPPDINGDWSVTTTVTRNTVVTSSLTDTWSVEAWGNALVESTVDPDPEASADELSTFYSYYPDGRPKSVSRPDGSWEYYGYQSVVGGVMTRTYSPWLSESELDYSGGVYSLPAAGLAIRRDSTYSANGHTENTYLEDLAGSDTQMGSNATSENEADGVTTTTIWRGSGEGQNVSSSSAVHVQGDGVERPIIDAWLVGRTAMTWDSGGKAELHEYEKGNWNGSSFGPAEDGEYLRESVTNGVAAFSGPIPDLVAVPGRTTRTRKVTGPDGVVLEEEQVLDPVSEGYETAVARFYLYEESGWHRPTGIKIGGVFVSRIEYHPSALVTRSHDENGTVTETETNAYDEIVRRTVTGPVTETAPGSLPDITTTYIRSGRTLTAEVDSRTVSEETRDAAGRLKSQRDSNGTVTTYSYPNGGRDLVSIRTGSGRGHPVKPLRRPPAFDNGKWRGARLLRLRGGWRRPPHADHHDWRVGQLAEDLADQQLGRNDCRKRQARPGGIGNSGIQHLHLSTFYQETRPYPLVGSRSGGPGSSPESD